MGATPTTPREVADGVYCMPSAEGAVNWALVVSADGLLAIDAGLPSAWDELAAMCRQLGRDRAELRAVLLTHGHLDHIGFAERARAELGVPVHIHPGDEKLLAHPMTASRPERLPLLYAGNSSMRTAAAQMFRAGALRTQKPEHTIPLTPGEILEDLPGSPRVHATPGHTAGHCSIELTTRGVLVGGDALVTYDPYTGADGPRLLARGSMRDSRQARASLDALAGIGSRILIPGHGVVWTEGTEKAAALAREATQG